MSSCLKGILPPEMPLSSTNSKPMFPASASIADSDEDSEIEFLSMTPLPATVRKKLHRSNSRLKRKQQLSHRRTAASRAHRNNRTSSDHIYASPSKGQGPKRDHQAVKIKELLLNQLDLIEKQSDDIVRKDELLRDLQRENEDLKFRLHALETKKSRRQHHQSTETELRGCVDRPLAVAATKSDEKPKHESPPAEEKKKKKRVLESQEAYFLLQGEEFIQQEQREIASILCHAEVPDWRVCPVASPPPLTFAAASPAGKECTSDATFLRRHSKLELDEKRRKRWDMQRIREQRQVEKLKARYQQVAPGAIAATAEEEPHWTLLPDPYKITHIEVCDALPLCAFGAVLPALDEDSFALPWDDCEKTASSEPVPTGGKKSKK